MDWDSAFIKELNARRQRERELAPEMAKREDSLLGLIGKSLYGEKVHYALELIQNAEDAESTTITFIFEKDKVVVANDGIPFTADDVDAICSVKPGRKKNKIGFFGVGFKSVFNITHAPQIISSAFNFQIKNYIYPEPLNHLPESTATHYDRQRGSVFVLPHSEGLPGPIELIQSFKEIDSKILLFLDDLKKLVFIDKINNAEWSIEKEPPSDKHTILKDGRTGESSQWRVFHKPLKVGQDTPIPEGKGGITDTRITLAFPADNKTEEYSKRTPIYCYLPTNKRSDMPFLVQADFVPTVGRENIQELP